MDWLVEFLENFMAWLLEVLLWVPMNVYELLLDGLAAIIEAIPVPDFIENMGSVGASIPPTVRYMLGELHFAEGLAIIIGAYIVRFLIRRIPVIG